MVLLLHIVINHKFFVGKPPYTLVNNLFINALNIYADIYTTCVTNDGYGWYMWLSSVVTSKAGNFSQQISNISVENNPNRTSQQRHKIIPKSTLFKLQVSKMCEGFFRFIASLNVEPKPACDRPMIFQYYSGICQSTTWLTTQRPHPNSVHFLSTKALIYKKLYITPTHWVTSFTGSPHRSQRRWWWAHGSINRISSISLQIATLTPNPRLWLEGHIHIFACIHLKCMYRNKRA